MNIGMIDIPVFFLKQHCCVCKTLIFPYMFMPVPDDGFTNSQKV
jgi:hypothetical protein